MKAFAVIKTSIDYARNPSEWTDQESASQIFSLKNMSFYLNVFAILLSISFSAFLSEIFFASGFYYKVTLCMERDKHNAKIAFYNCLEKVIQKTAHCHHIHWFIMLMILVTTGLVYLLFNNAGTFKGHKFGNFTLLYYHGMDEPRVRVCFQQF